MSSLSKEAVLVHEALVARGLETPMRAPVQEIDNETRKRLITGHMTEITRSLSIQAWSRYRHQPMHPAWSRTVRRMRPLPLRYHRRSRSEWSLAYRPQYGSAFVP